MANDSAVKSLTQISVIEIPNGSKNLSPYSSIGNDVYFYVSGSKDTIFTNDRRVAVFGGDVVISGSLTVKNCELTGSFSFDCDAFELTGSLEVEGHGIFSKGISGSLTQLANGKSYLTSGTGIQIISASNGQIIISSTTGFSAIEWNEKVTGNIDGINSIFTLAFTPSNPSSIMVFLNGILQENGINEDYTILNTTITFNIPVPQIGSKITATYSK